MSYISHYRCIKTGGNTSLGVDTALGRNGTRVPATVASIILPLPDAGWAVSSVQATYGASATYSNIASMPGAITVSGQISPITITVDCRPLGENLRDHCHLQINNN